MHLLAIPPTKCLHWKPWGDIVAQSFIENIPGQMLPCTTIWLIKLGYSRKNPNTGGVKIWNFQGYQRNSMCNFHRLWKSHVEFPGVLVFGLGISKGWNTILQNFQVWNSVLPRISRGKVKKWKIPGGFSKKYVLNPPFCFFSGIAHCRIYDKMGIWEFEMVQNCLLSWSITRTVFGNLLSFYWCW